MNSIIQPAAPAAVIYQRLLWHSTNALGLLYGLKVYETPEWRVEGEQDLPNLCVIDFSDEEGIFAGAVTGAYENANSVVSVTQTMILMLTVRRENGLFAKGTTAVKGLLDWMALIRDAVETNESGVVDSLLDETCERPFLTSMRDNVVRELSWSAGIQFTLYPRATVRGTRKDRMTL